MAIISSGPVQLFWTTSTGAVVTASSGSNFQFGFRPLHLRIENLGAVNLWALFNSTGLASTDDLLITTCSPMNTVQLALGSLGIDKVSLAATSTATSAYSIWALG